MLLIDFTARDLLVFSSGFSVVLLFGSYNRVPESVADLFSSLSVTNVCPSLGRFVLSDKVAAKVADVVHQRDDYQTLVNLGRSILVLVDIHLNHELETTIAGMIHTRFAPITTNNIVRTRSEIILHGCVFQSRLTQTHSRNETGIVAVATAVANRTNRNSGNQCSGWWWWR